MHGLLQPRPSDKHLGLCLRRWSRKCNKSNTLVTIHQELHHHRHGAQILPLRWCRTFAMSKPTTICTDRQFIVASSPHVHVFGLREAGVLLSATPTTLPLNLSSPLCPSPEFCPPGCGAKPRPPGLDEEAPSLRQPSAVSRSHEPTSMASSWDTGHRGFGKPIPRHFPFIKLLELKWKKENKSGCGPLSVFFHVHVCVHDWRNRASAM